MVIQRERLFQSSRHSLIVTRFQMEGLGSASCLLVAFLGHRWIYLGWVKFREDGWKRILEEYMRQKVQGRFFCLVSPSSSLQLAECEMSIFIADTDAEWAEVDLLMFLLFSFYSHTGVTSAISRKQHCSSLDFGDTRRRNPLKKRWDEQKLAFF